MRSNRTNLQYIILTALFTALTAVGAFIKIPVGPAPISAQLLFIALAGMVIGPYWGAVSQILYVALGLMGLPVFTSGGGLSYIYNPSFGFLLGFIFVPVIIGGLMRKYEPESFVVNFIIVIAGMLSCHIIGVPYMYFILHNVVGNPITIWKTFMVGCIIFIPGDIAKALVCTYIGQRLKPVLKDIKG
ncbi:MAG: biotin transporter BioY [Hornefia sp.]|nr:biotin transporter BioY [Hornefia sp.]